MNKQESPYFVAEHLVIQKDYYAPSAEVTQYVQKIRALHREVCCSETAIIYHKKTTLEAAIKCGEYLLKCKGIVPHGQWEKFLNDYFWQTLHPRTASNYMRLAERQGQLDREKIGSLRSAYIEIGILKVGQNKYKPTEELSVWNPGVPKSKRKHVSDSAKPNMSATPTTPLNVSAPAIVAPSIATAAAGDAEKDEEWEAEESDDTPPYTGPAIYIRGVRTPSEWDCELPLVHGEIDWPTEGEDADALYKCIEPLATWLKTYEEAKSKSRLLDEVSGIGVQFEATAATPAPPPDVDADSICGTAEKKETTITE